MLPIHARGRWFHVIGKGHSPKPPRFAHDTHGAHDAHKFGYRAAQPIDRPEEAREVAVATNLWLWGISPGDRPRPRRPQLVRQFEGTASQTRRCGVILCDVHIRTAYCDNIGPDHHIQSTCHVITCLQDIQQSLQRWIS